MNTPRTLLQPYMTLNGNPLYREMIDGYVRVHGNKPPPKEAYEVVLSGLTELYQVGDFMSQEQILQLESDASIIMLLLQWRTCGKNCFVFTKELIDEFLTKESRAEDIPANVLKLPYQSFYLKFGRHSGIQAIRGKDRWVDGCYVESHPEGILVTYTQIADDESTGSTGLHFLFRLEGADTVGDALEAGLLWDDDKDGYREQIANEIGGDAPRFFSDTQSMRDQAQNQRDEVAPKVARLVASCLAYILFVPDDVQDDFLGAPEALVSKLRRSSTPKEEARNLSKLEAQGYSLVKLCGRTVTRQMEEIRTGSSSVRPHWRRGHWRLQPVGVGLSQLRLTWVRPTVVRADRGTPEFGHLYEP